MGDGDGVGSPLPGHGEACRRRDSPLATVRTTRFGRLSTRPLSARSGLPLAAGKDGVVRGDEGGSRFHSQLLGQLTSARMEEH